MISKDKYIVSLTGGIGNQLFQYAYAISRISQNQISVTTKFDKKIEDKTRSSILTTNLDIKLESTDIVFTIAKWRVHNLIMRLSTAVEQRQFLFPAIALVQDLVAFLASRTIFRGTTIECQPSIGFSQKKEKSCLPSSLQIGYFQHCNWENSEDVKETLMGIEVRDPSDSYLEIKSILQNKKFLSVHMRFGDYLQEDKLGVLPKSYFDKAIDWHLIRENYDEIVIFANDGEKAAHYLSPGKDKKIRIISEKLPLSDLEVFQLMRSASGYVIANSTFSWWGAFLSFNENRDVVYPFPWFKQIQTPNGLFPKGWNQVESFSDK